MDRFLTTLFFFTILSFTLFSQEVETIEAEGNLETTKPLPCVTLKEVTTSHTPADIYAGLENCLKSEDYENAAHLFAIAGVYGIYDTKRVKDRSAHQALSVLRMRVLSALTEEQKDAFFSVLKEQLAGGSDNLYEICEKINQKGHPTYFPKYMIQHGMGAFTNDQDEPLVADFDAEKAFQEALNQYLHCDE